MSSHCADVRTARAPPLFFLRPPPEHTYGLPPQPASRAMIALADLDSRASLPPRFSYVSVTPGWVMRRFMVKIAEAAKIVDHWAEETVFSETSARAERPAGPALNLYSAIEEFKAQPVLQTMGIRGTSKVKVAAGVSYKEYYAPLDESNKRSGPPKSPDGSLHGGSAKISMSSRLERKKALVEMLQMEIEEEEMALRTRGWHDK